MLKIGVIGGSGLYDIPGLAVLGEESLQTPYGDPSDKYRIMEISGEPETRIVFLPRHGSRHSIPPHRINYRANLWGMKALEVERVIAVNAVGGISPSLRPGAIVLQNQLIDFTEGARKSTFYDEEDVVHIDFTSPYCPELRDSLVRAASKSRVDVAGGGTYACVNGPRLETAAEIRFLASIGADVVGMTGMPEASLARELEICYAGISVVTNYAAGILEDKKLTTTEVVQVMGEATGRIKGILREAFGMIPVKRACPCSQALRDSRL
jgi:5'-methylthioadenosine phosphorylase